MLSGRLGRALQALGRAMSDPEPPAEDPRTAHAGKAAQIALVAQLQTTVRSGGALPRLADCGFRVFSQFDEDGLLLFLAAVLEIQPKTFVDIGASDGICSNCANLALNHGWHGLFVDADDAGVRRGEAFYAAHPDTSLYPPVFRRAVITRENVDAIVAGAGFSGDIGLLSIDIDGNDYWVWEALTVVQPAVVIVESHIEFGMRDLVVPYDASFVYPGVHPDYFGASAPALVRLGRKKGYRLVGANRFGFNLLFARSGLFEERVPEVSIESVLTHVRHRERLGRFDAVQHLPFVEDGAVPVAGRRAGDPRPEGNS